MLKQLLITCAIVMLGASVSAQPPQEKPGPEHKSLEHFAGNWTLQGKMNPSPMGPGGPFSGTESCRMFEGGFHMVCDSTGTGAMGNMTGHMVLTWDRSAKTYRFFSVSNMADAEAGTGSVKGNTWTFNSSMEMNGKKILTRFVLVETSPTVHTAKSEMSEDGTKWTTVMEATSTKK